MIRQSPFPPPPPMPSAPLRSTPPPTPPTASSSDGQQRRDDAFAVLQAHRQFYIRRACRTLLSILLRQGKATADDVRAVMHLPPHINPNLFGAAFGQLSRKKLIQAVGFTTSARPSRHAGPNRIWAIADTAAVHQWLHDHPDLPEPEEHGNGGTTPTTPPIPSPPPAPPRRENPYAR